MKRVLFLTMVAMLVNSSSMAQSVASILDSTGVAGGLVVHVGCGDGRLTADLGSGDGFVVQGLDGDARNVKAARDHIRSLDLYGKVSIARWEGSRLPYIDNLVNLVVSERLGAVSMDEVMRVLVPNGVAYIKQDGEWSKRVKPRPAELDEWTHYLHDASGNAVAHDSVVGPPRRLQWVGNPKWSRHHEHMSSTSALVSSGGRNFCIIDEGPRSSILLPPKWTLVARDAFNGAVLWKRSIAKWQSHRWPFKSGHAQLPRRLVGEGDRVYVTLGIDAPVSVLDAATGKTIQVYEGSHGAEGIVASDGDLFLVVNDAPIEWDQYNRPRPTKLDEQTGEKIHVREEWAWDEQGRRVMAVKAESGEILWQKENCPVVPLTLAVDRQSVFFHDGESIVRLNRKTGDQVWRSAPVKRRSPLPTSFAPTLVVYQDVVLFSGGDRTMASLSVKNGETLWTAEHPRGGHHSPEDILVVNGLAWAGALAGDKDYTGIVTDSGILTGRDPYTGDVKHEFPPDTDVYFMHHRCYRAKATDRYLLTSRTGVEFVDPETGHWQINHWVRGGCLYGIMPANGLLYTTPHPCACYMGSKLSGFLALAPKGTDSGRLPPANERSLEKGTAYGKVREPRTVGNSAQDWPTYRHNPARSGFTHASVPADLERAWRTELGGRLSSVVIADKRVFVASVDAHTVYALDAGNGKPIWSYTAGGRIDSPPTIHKGRAIFGCRDGWVYSLRASDGELDWRFRAAPREERLMAMGQLESVWPVHGSVLALDDVIAFVAGRSMFLDGGMRLYRLDPETGRKISETVLDDRDPDTGSNLQTKIFEHNMPPALPDVLSCDGKYIYMRSQQFDLDGARSQVVAPRDPTDQKGPGTHIFCPTGFLDDSSFHRSYWVFGKTFTEGPGQWRDAGRNTPAGLLLAFDESSVYGYARLSEYYKWTTPVEYHLFASDKEPGIALHPKKRTPNGIEFRWSEPMPLQSRALVVTDKTLFVAGPPDVLDEAQAFKYPEDPSVPASIARQDAALAGEEGALLRVTDVTDGGKLAEYQLESSPVWDGMAAANGRIHLALMDGAVVCYRAAK